MYLSECQIIKYDSIPEDFAICTGNCVVSNEQYSVVITYDDYQRLLNGEKLEDVLEYLNPADREFLITGICPNSFKKIFFRTEDDLDNIDEKELYTLKSDWLKFDEVIKLNNIKRLFHFTDRKNIYSIKNSFGLLSNKMCSQNGINIPRPGGDDFSINLDKQRGLDDFIRLSFCKEHPMLFTAIKDNRISEPVILEISPEVIFFSHTRFTNQNALKSGTILSDSFDFFSKIKFDIFKSRYFDLENQFRSQYQAEVLVLRSLPNKYILNIRDI